MLGCDAGRGGFCRADGGLQSPGFFGWKKSCCPRTTSLEPSPSEASSSSWRNRRWLEKNGSFPQNEGKKSRHGKRPEENGNWWKWILKKKRPPISWVQSFWGKKTSVYIGYRLGYRSARHISYNTLSKGPLSNLRLSMKSKVLFCVVRYANR